MQNTRLRGPLLLSTALLGLAVAGPAEAYHPIGGGVEPLIAGGGAHRPEYMAGQVLVKFKQAPPEPARLSRELGVRLEVIRRVSGGELLYRVRDTGPDRVMALVSAFRARGDVVYAQPNYVVRPLSVPDDPMYPDQWHYSQLDLEQAWDITTGSSDVTVAVLDTGITAHPDIADKVVDGYDFITNPVVAGDGDGRDPDPTDLNRFKLYHGVHVAGIVGAESNNGLGTAGVCWNCMVEPLRVMGMYGDLADVVDAIRWAAGLPVPDLPSNPNPARVINMSLGEYTGGPCADTDPATQAAITDAVSVGVTVVVAAGNDMIDAGLFSPASCDGTITVAATFFPDTIALYSNWGEYVDVAAPGGSLMYNIARKSGVLSLFGDEDYHSLSGTSQASPHVAGVAGLLLSLNPALTPAQVQQILMETAIPMDAEHCPNGCGAGFIDPVSALELASSY